MPDEAMPKRAQPGSEPRDFLELLTEDHRTVEGLFERYHEGDTSTMGEVCARLQAHMTLEEELVYTILSERDEELARHGEHEHEQVRDLINELGQSSANGPELMMHLEATVAEHVLQEESRAFPLLRQIDDGLRRQLGARIAARQQELQRVA
jgi:hemerythrin superfamily protein